MKALYYFIIVFLQSICNSFFSIKIVFNFLDTKRNFLFTILLKSQIFSLHAISLDIKDFSHIFKNYKRILKHILKEIYVQVVSPLISLWFPVPKLPFLLAVYHQLI